MIYWAVYTTSTGALLGVTAAPVHPNQSGYAFNAATMSVKNIGTAIPDPATYSWDIATKTFIEDAAKVEAILIPLVKSANEQLVRGTYSQNYGKQKKYSRKQQEVLDYRALGGSAGTNLSLALNSIALTVPLATLTLNQQKKKFRFAMAQAQKRGVALDVVIGEFEAAIDNSEAMVANWEAIELESIRLIKAASTASAKRAVYAAINWNWTAT